MFYLSEMCIGTSGKSPKFGMDDIRCWKSEKIKRKKSLGDSFPKLGICQSGWC